MSLMAAFNEATKGWDPKKDSTQMSSNLPAGDYNVIVEKVDHPVYKSGWDCLRFTMLVFDGEHAGRKEFVQISLAEKKKDGSPLPDFVIAQNIRYVVKIAEMVGLKLTETNFNGNETDLYENFVQLFKPYTGKSMQMTISTRPNRKDPDNPYRLYDFGPGKQIETPAADQGSIMEQLQNAGTEQVTDENLPF